MTDRDLTSTGAGTPKGPGFSSSCPQMRDLELTVERIAPTDASVLILGETGTGKEILARAIHTGSGRKGPFVPVNCASIPDALADSELFGHEKGAFTGAEEAKAGLFRRAHGGSLLLDEIGNMPLTAQFSLLRVLQEGKIRPVGSTREIPVDVRVIAATSVPLESAIGMGVFREDLFYRLDVVRLVVPPLREREGDVVPLFESLVLDLSARYDVPCPRARPEFLERLRSYRWPGNVRQLRNFVERLVLMRAGTEVTGEDFDRLNRSYIRPGPTAPPSPQPISPTNELHASPAPSSQAPPTAAPTPTSSSPTPTSQAVASPGGDADGEIDLSVPLEQHIQRATENIERRYLKAVLRANVGRVALSANQAGMSRRTFLRRMKAYGIRKSEFKPGDDRPGGGRPVNPGSGAEERGGPDSEEVE